MHLIKIIFVIIFVSISLLRGDWVESINKKTELLNQKLLIVKEPTTGLVFDQLLADAVIAGWGFKNWNWGEKSFHFKNEGWFQKDTATGGADKTGHFYMTYLLSRVMSARMEQRGWEKKKATLAGSLSAMLSMTLLEVGDGTGSYGFSREDLLSDFLGALSAYYIRTNPKIDDLLDIRLEYLPTKNYLSHPDVVTDYSGMKHLAAFKFSGIQELGNTPLKYIELQAGYYTRGYRRYDKALTRSQQVYFGIGINLSELAKKSRLNILENAMEFYQPGHTYIETDIWRRDQ